MELSNVAPETTMSSEPSLASACQSFEPAAAAARMGAAVTAAAAAPFVATALAIVAMGPQQGPHRRLVRVVASAAARPLYRDGRGARLSCGPPPGPAALSRLHSRSALSL